MKETKDIFWQKVTGTKALAATEWQQNTNKECKPYVISETSLCFHIQEWSLPKKRDFPICHKRNWTLSKWCFSWCIANSHCLSPFTAFCFILNWDSSLQLKMGTAIPLLWHKLSGKKGHPPLAVSWGDLGIREVELAWEWMSPRTHQSYSCSAEHLLQHWLTDWNISRWIAGGVKHF